MLPVPKGVTIQAMAGETRRAWVNSWGLVWLAVAVGLMGCSNDDAKPEQTKPTKVPAQSRAPKDREAIEMAKALAVYYGEARKAFDAYNTARRCAEGDNTDPKRDACLERCSSSTMHPLDCHGVCYGRFGGKRTPKARMECMTPLRGELMVIVSNMPANKSSSRCAKQVESAVVGALRKFQDAKGDPKTGYLPPFPWGDIHDGYEKCAGALFKCGRNRVACQPAILAGGLGLRPKGSLGADFVWLPSGKRIEGDQLHRL